MNRKELEQLEARLANWRVWWSHFDSGSAGQRSCGSAERRYVAPRPDDEKAAAKAISNVDIADAEQIHEAMGMLEWNPTRRFLHSWYGRAGNPRQVLRVLKIELADLDSVRLRCLSEMAIALARLERSRVVLIRRGKSIWAGQTVANQNNQVYKGGNAVASTGPSVSRDQPSGWSRSPRDQEAKEPA